MSTLSVVIPMHRTRRCLTELLDRLAVAVPGAQVVLVDDACPEGSGEAALALSGRLPAGLSGRLVSLTPGVGQHSAVLIGITQATGAVTAVMDADLQDRPEDLPPLVEALVATGADVVAAGRRGDYEARGRIRSGRCYRAVMHRASRGRLPADAGMFLVMSSAARTSVIDLGDPRAPLLPALARAGMQIVSTPVTRAPRAHGRSATPSRTRVGVAVRALLTVLPTHRLVRPIRVARWRSPSLTITDLGGPR